MKIRGLPYELGYQPVIPNTYKIDAEIEAICEYLGVEIVTDTKEQTKCIKKGKERKANEAQI